MVDTDPRHQSGGRRKGIAMLLLATAFVGAAWLLQWRLSGSGSSTHTEPGKPERPIALDDRVIPAEFEPHEALLICWPLKDMIFVPGKDTKQLNDAARSTVLAMIEAVRRRIQVILLVESSEARRLAVAAMNKRGIPPDSIRIVEAAHDSVWVRDFGPLVTRRSTGPLWLSCWKAKRPVLHSRNHMFAHEIARQFGVFADDVPLYLDGGNILSNGRGLVLLTTQVLDDNLRLGYDEDRVEKLIKIHLGAEQVVFLEPLKDETTGHVDLFATFTSPDTVVLGQYDRDDDPVNHALLERNAKKLRAVQTPGGPLKVVRVPMAPRGETVFGGSYTNVVYANGVCLVPSYGPIDRVGLEKAMATYRRLLPDWKVVPINAVEWIVQQGALHCLTSHIYELPASMSRPRQPGEIRR